MDSLPIRGRLKSFTEKKREPLAFLKPEASGFDIACVQIHVLFLYFCTLLLFAQGG